MRNAILALFLVVILSSAAFAGFGSYSSYPQSSDTIVAPVLIKDNGIHNLVVSINFLKKPYDSRIYNSDEYENFINRLEVEWSGVAIQQILITKEQTLNDLNTLKKNIEAAVQQLSENLKNKYSLEKNAEVVFSISNFYLIKTDDNK